ncbi:hypothetical protein [Halopenitus persicus]|uniref:Uncharacterized protein n=1 Tax=Halopenitus persicus TaxID=1048396 RepID=A0A1H3JRP6_9EURY|nr:hypothetical protein [Halopenitus persicus]QHS15769.1 hypothetical protein GWK26_00645 [haloarchaeon 3A1-DGR]SDY42607.1 hypothetical protein SAMN05216564_105119 [Halopenitus persicus]
MDSDSSASMSVAGQPSVVVDAKANSGTFTFAGNCSDRSGFESTIRRLGYRGSSGYCRLPHGQGLPA